MSYYQITPPYCKNHAVICRDRSDKNRSNSKSMLSRSILISLLLLLMPVLLKAQSFTGGQLHYSVLSEEDKTCAVTGCSQSGGDLVIPSEVEFKGNKYTVTTLGNQCFAMRTFASVKLPETLTTVGQYAFVRADINSDVVFTSRIEQFGRNVFEQATVNAVVFKKGVTNELSSVFWNSSVKEIVINGCSGLGFYACANTHYVKYFDITGDNLSFGNGSINVRNAEVISIHTSIFPTFDKNNGLYAFDTPISEDDDPTQVGWLGELRVHKNLVRQYKDCEPLQIVKTNGGNLTFVGLSDQITMDIDGVEYKVETLTYENGTKKVNILECNPKSSSDVKIPSYMTIEGEDIPVTEITRYAFSDNTDLKSVTIPSSVDAIRNGAFSNCPNLSKVIILNPDANALGDFNPFEYIAKDAKLIVPDESIDAFAHIKGFSDIMRFSEAFAFETDGFNYLIDGDYVSLTGTTLTDEKIEIPAFVEYEGVKYPVKRIAENAFKDNVVLKGLTIPNGITSIGANAFNGCSNLEKVTLLSEVAPVLGEGAFDEAT